MDVGTSTREHSSVYDEKRTSRDLRNAAGPELRSVRFIRNTSEETVKTVSAGYSTNYARAVKYFKSMR